MMMSTAVLLVSFLLYYLNQIRTECAALQTSVHYKNRSKFQDREVLINIIFLICVYYTYYSIHS